MAVVQDSDLISLLIYSAYNFSNRILSIHILLTDIIIPFADIVKKQKIDGTKIIANGVSEGLKHEPVKSKLANSQNQTSRIHKIRTREFSKCEVNYNNIFIISEQHSSIYHRKVRRVNGYSACSNNASASALYGNIRGFVIESQSFIRLPHEAALLMSQNLKKNKNKANANLI